MLQVSPGLGTLSKTSLLESSQAIPQKRAGAGQGASFICPENWLLFAVPAGGSGLTIRTTIPSGPSPPVASPVLPVSTPSQGLGPGYTITPPAQPSTASSSPALQSFLAAMTHPDAPTMPQAAMQPGQLPGMGMVTAPVQIQAQAFPPAMAAAPQQSMVAVQSPAVQSPAQAATPSSAAPAGY